MPYFETWDEFAARAEELYLHEPERTRYSIKFRHSDSLVVLKVTDDKVCLKYRTDQQQDVKRLVELNNTLMRHMTSKSG
eukprot:m.22442 g.22442  ORF g.22442 m.22442 type:complete len:79 (-) comp6818_c0_seq1:109-345(-)